MKLIALVAAVLLLPQEKNEAEELFKKMEAKFATAKTIHLKLEGEMKEQAFKLTGSFLLGEGNLGRCGIEAKQGEVTESIGVISDGKSVQVTSNQATQNKPFETPETLGKLMRKCLSRAGGMGTIDATQGEQKAKADPETAFVASDFKLGPKEKVGDREAQAIGYRLTRKSDKDTAVTLWIDAETHLPLKRVVKMGTKVLSEMYSEVKLDEKIDPAKFELPKEAK